MNHKYRSVLMNKTPFAVTALIASLSLAFVVPASFAESKTTPNASCHTCKQCSAGKKCDKCDTCNKSSTATKNHKNCSSSNCNSCNHDHKK